MKLGLIGIFLVISMSFGAQGLRFIRNRPTRRIRLLHEDQCDTVVKIDCLDQQVRSRFRSERRRPSQNVCAQLTDEQLVQKLKDIGGYNPLYVAINKTEAKKFKDPRTFEFVKQPITPKPTRATDCKDTQKPTTQPNPTTTSFPATTTSIPVTRNPRTVFSTPSRLRSPQYARKQASDPGEMSPLETLLKNLRDRKEEDLEYARKRIKRNINGNHNCWQKGATVRGSRSPVRVHMCSECQLMTRLPADVAPQYINEAACGHTLPVQSGQPSENNQCFASSGLCVQKILRFPALRRRGYVKDNVLSARKGMNIYVEDWVSYTQDIRASCQCQLYNSLAQLLNSLDANT